MNRYWIAAYSQANADGPLGKYFLARSLPPNFKWSLFGPEDERIDFNDVGEAAHVVVCMFQGSQCLENIEVSAHLAFTMLNEYCPDAAFIGIVDAKIGNIVHVANIAEGLAKVKAKEEQHRKK